MRRVLGRCICPVCTSVPNIYSANLGHDLKCPFDGAKLVARPDDYEDAVIKRLQIYETHIRAILSYYCRAAVMRVDAECEADLLTHKMLAAVSILKK